MLIPLTAKAGYEIMLNKAESVSFEFDSRGNIHCNIVLHQ